MSKDWINKRLENILEVLGEGISTELNENIQSLKARLEFGSKKETDSAKLGMEIMKEFLEQQYE